MDTDQVQAAIDDNKQHLAEMGTSWEDRLAEAKKQWETSQAAAPVASQLATECYLQNVNEDPQLSGILHHVLLEGKCLVGQTKKTSEPPAGFAQKISLNGLSIQPQHAIFTRHSKKVTITPLGGAHVSLSFSCRLSLNS